MLYSLLPEQKDDAHCTFFVWHILCVSVHDWLQ